MIKYLLSLLLLIGSISLVSGQNNSFIEECIGEWEGKLRIYRAGFCVDSLPMKMIVAYNADSSHLVWATHYHSQKDTIKKDYILIPKDTIGYAYNLDEQNEIILLNYIVKDKQVSTYEVGDMFYFTSYQIINGKMIFEIYVSRAKSKDQSENKVTSHELVTTQIGTLSREQ